MPPRPTPPMAWPWGVAAWSAVDPPSRITPWAAYFRSISSTYCQWPERLVGNPAALDHVHKPILCGHVSTPAGAKTPLRYSVPLGFRPRRPTFRPLATNPEPHQPKRPTQGRLRARSSPCRASPRSSRGAVYRMGQRFHRASRGPGGGEGKRAGKDDDRPPPEVGRLLMGTRSPRPLVFVFQSGQLDPGHPAPRRRVIPCDPGSQLI
jgi:hypothetical protein